MKKARILTICILLICLTACTHKEDKSSPVVAIRVVPYLAENYLEWSIKNYDTQKSIVFLDGNRLNYSIRHIPSHKTYSNENLKSKDTYTLKPQDTYYEKVEIFDIKEKGEYEATFWAVTEEGITYKTIFTFKRN